ncbi:MAG: hypothetical protein WAO91_08930 [Candidatus Nitrosotenuis sp.]
MVSLSIEETKTFVERLLTVGKGDPGRLNHILALLKEGRKLFQSDERYLDFKLAQELGIVPKPKRDENLIDRIQRLVDARHGDTGRLKFILEVLRHGRPLYKTDQLYLERQFGEKFADISSKFKIAKNAEFEHLRNERFSEIITKLADLEYQTALGNQRVISVESLVCQTNEKFSNMETALTQTNEKFTSMATAIEDTNGKVSSIESSLSQTNDKFSTLESALTQTNEKFSSLASAIADTNSKVSSIESSLSQTNDKFSTLESALTQTNDKFSSLATVITDAGDKVSTMSSTISLTYTKISSLGSDITVIKNKVSSLELKTATAMTGLSSALSQVSSMEAKLNQINDELSKFTAGLSANSEKIASLETKVAKPPEKGVDLDAVKEGHCKNCGKKLAKKSSQFCSTECALQHINKENNE